MQRIVKAKIICPLCNRLIKGIIENHHLIPQSKGGKKKGKIRLHISCHDKIHEVFTEKELAEKYNTIEVILKNPRIKTYINYIRKKPDDYVDSKKFKII